MGADATTRSPCAPVHLVSGMSAPTTRRQNGHGVRLKRLHVLQVMDAPRREKLAHKGESNKVLKKYREMRSLRCDLAYKLKVLLPHTALIFLL